MKYLSIPCSAAVALGSDDAYRPGDEALPVASPDEPTFTLAPGVALDLF